MENLGFSSEIYTIDPRDLVVLEDSLLLSEKDDDVILLIGDEKKNIPDTLLKGRETVERAIIENKDYIPVRVAFVPRTKKYDFISPLIRKLRYKYKSFSSNIYHTTPMDIRRLRIERSFRTKENAYSFTKKKYRLGDEIRNELYENLYNSMKANGYDDKYPIDILLCRNLGVQDTVDQGHHRMSVAIDCQTPRIAVRFGAAGQAPKFLQPLFRIIARINLLFKQ